LQTAAEPSWLLRRSIAPLGLRCLSLW